MSKCVFRTDLRLQPVSETHPCVEASELFYRPWASTILECVQRLLAPDEICRGSSDKREIWRGPKVVGFVRIVDLHAGQDRKPS
jgi:hypothetical protein